MRRRLIERDWEKNSRWNGITRDYSPIDVLRLRGSIDIQHTLAEMGAKRLWDLLQDEPYVAALGALTGNQAIQQVRAGLKAIYLSGWQVAADANLGRADVSRSESLSLELRAAGRQADQPGAAARRSDRSQRRAGRRDWFAPIIADAEGGLRRTAERVRADEDDDRGRRGRRFTSRTSSPPRRSAVTSAARCSCRRRSSSAR